MRLTCPSSVSRALSNSCSLSWQCHPTISSSVVPFSSHLQSFPESASFLRSQFFESGGKVLELQHQSFQWIFRTDFFQDWLVKTPCSSRDSQESSPTPQFKSISSSVFTLLHGPILTSMHDYWEKTTALTRWAFIGKIIYLSRLILMFLPRGKHLGLSLLQSPSSVILEPKEIKSVIVSIVSPSFRHEVMGLDAMIFIFINVEF